MAEPRTEVRCPACTGRARMLGKRDGHDGCASSIEIKCGKCGQLVLVPLDPDIHPYIQFN